MSSLRTAALSFLLLGLLFTADGLAAGRELAPRPLIPTPVSGPGPIVASAGGRFLTVWGEADGRHSGIYGVLSEANGHRISPSAFLIAESALQDAVVVDLVGTNDSFALFWTTDEVTSTNPHLPRHIVHMTDIDLDGVVLATRTLALPSAERLSVAWDGERFLAAIHRENWLRNRSQAALLTRDGTILREGILLEPNATPIHVAATDDGFIVFSAGRDFFAHVIDDGVIEDGGSARQLIAGDPAAGVISAPIGDGRLLVAYGMGDGQLRAAVWKNGAKLRETTVTVEHHHGASPVGILRGNGRHLLAFLTRDTLYTIQLDDDGTPASEPLPAATNVRGPRGASSAGVLFVGHRFQPLFSTFVASIALRSQSEIGERETLSIRPAAQSHVLVGAGGGSMLAVWNESVAASWPPRILTAVIDRGYTSENVRELAPYGTLAVRSLAWNGSEYLVVYHNHWELLAQRLSYDGDPIGEPTSLGETGRPYAAVTWAGDRWAIAWAESDGDSVIRYRTMSRSGFARPLQELRYTGNLIVEVALAFDGNRVHLAWTESSAPYTHEGPPIGYAAYTARIRRNGRRDTAPLSLPTTWPNHVSMASNGDEIVILVDDYHRTAANIVSASTHQFLTTRTLFDGIARSNVTWNGYEFVAAMRYRSAAGSFVEVRHLGDDGTASDDPRITQTLEAGDPYLSVASSPSYDAVTGLQEVDAASGARAVIYAAREMFQRPDP